MAPKKKIQNKKSTMQIVNLATNKGKSQSKKPRTQKQIEASKQNLGKARQAKAAYQELRRQGFDRYTIYSATQTIQNALQRMDMNADNNPAVSMLFNEIGSFKSEEDIENMTQSEYYRYATSIRSFLGNPLSSEDAHKYLQDRLSNELFAQSLLIRDNEEFEAYKERRARFIKSTADTISKKAFEIYRRVMETNAGQIIKAKMSPAAYGSDNLIVDIFDFVSSGQWDDNIDDAAAYWQKIINDQYAENLELRRATMNREAIELEKFNWKGVETYGAFIRAKS